MNIYETELLKIRKLYSLEILVSLLWGGEKCFKFAFIISILFFESGDLILMRSLLPLAFFFIALDCLINVDIEAFDLFGKALAFLLQLSDLILHVVLALLCHEGLAHTVSN